MSNETQSGCWLRRAFVIRHSEFDIRHFVIGVQQLNHSTNSRNRVIPTRSDPDAMVVLSLPA